MWRRISKLGFKISRRAQSAVKGKNPTISVGNRIELLFGILTFEFRVFYFYLLFFNLFIFHAFRVLVILCLVFRRSGVPAFLHFGVPCFSTSPSTSPSNQYKLPMQIY